MTHHFILLRVNLLEVRIYKVGWCFGHSVSYLWVYWSAEGAKKVSWPCPEEWVVWLWHSLANLLICMYIYIYIYIYINIYIYKYIYDSFCWSYTDYSNYVAIFVFGTLLDTHFLINLTFKTRFIPFQTIAAIM